MNEKLNYNPILNLNQAPSHKTKRGFGAIPILESQIIEAQRNARSASEAARLLGVSYNTYKKYAKLYGILENLKNPRGIGIHKGINDRYGMFSVQDIMEGKHPNYPAWKLKRRLLLSGYKEEKCEVCGYSERRITDYRVPLALDFIDGNKRNFAYDNLRMLCLNCTFLINGNLNGQNKDYTY